MTSGRSAPLLIGNTPGKARTVPGRGAFSNPRTGASGSGRILGVSAQEGTSFCVDVDVAQRARHELIDVHTQVGAASERSPAVVFVHGGPLPPQVQPRPRDSPIFLGYAALAAATGLVAIMFNHRLHTDADYPLAAEDVASAVDQTRALDTVDPDRIGLWFFSGGGALAGEWLATPPAWLRCIAWTYPLLAPPPDWSGERARFDAVAAVGASPALPKLLVRVGGELPFLAQTQDAFVHAARVHRASLEVIEVPDAPHGFEALTYTGLSRAAVNRAIHWIATALHKPTDTTNTTNTVNG